MMYMSGRLRTASMPSRILIESSVYSFLFFGPSGDEGGRASSIVLTRLSPTPELECEVLEVLEGSAPGLQRREDGGAIERPQLLQQRRRAHLDRQDLVAEPAHPRARRDLRADDFSPALLERVACDLAPDLRLGKEPGEK